MSEGRTRWVLKKALEAFIGLGAIKLGGLVVASVVSFVIALFAYDSGYSWPVLIALVSTTLFCLTGAANQISKIIHRRRHPAVANGGNRLEPGPTECSEQWLHDVAAEQAQHLNSLVQIVNGL